MNFLILLLVSASMAAEATTSGHLTHGITWRIFADFERKFGKTYADENDRLQRFGIFANNLMEVQRHNRVRGATSWQKGINEFSDLTEDEFRQQYLGGYLKLAKTKSTKSHHGRMISERKLGSGVSSLNLPKSMDWREKGVVTKVKNQGRCGSCWAFTAVEQIESYLKIEEGGQLEVLSPQHICSCTPNPLRCGGSGGCSGSIPQMAFNYAELFGVVRESEYPYVSGISGITEHCKFNANKMKNATYVSGHETLPHNDLEEIMHHLATVGPLAISVDASEWALYSGGVFDGCRYDRNIELNHAVQLVGYGTDKEFGDFWLVRNSWGESWGENGYIRLIREPLVECGMDHTPAVGSACKNDGIVEEMVCGRCGVLFEASYPIGTRSNRGII